jgi:hypothetical protein
MHKTEPKTWVYRDRIIEESFESWADRAPEIFLKHRTGYMIRAHNFTEENEGPFVPGRYRTLAEAKRGVDEVLKEGVW